jgi:hypothetical protein
LKVEFILDAGKLLHMPLLTMFNYFLEEGFPEALSTRVVHVLFAMPPNLTTTGG